MAFLPPAVDEVDESQPKFTPPAVDEVDLSQVQLSPYDRYKIAVSQGATPENFSEIPGLPPSQNPDYDIVRQGGAVPGVSGALKFVSEKVIEPAAAQLFTALKRAGAADVPVTEDQKGKGAEGMDLKAVEPGVPMLSLPRLTPEEMQGATPTERAVAGIGEGLAQTIEGFTTPGGVATLPFAEFKPVQAYYGAQMGMAIPDSLKAISEAKTPDEIAKAYTSLTANIGMGSLLAHSAFKESAPRAKVPGPEGAPPPEVRAAIGQNDLLQQQAVAANAPQPQVSLSPEHSKLLEPHMGEEGKSVFGKLPDGRIMMADHENGQIIVDPQEFAKFVDNDLKGMSPKEKAAAVKSKFDHEDIHLKTDPEDAEPFWNSMSPFEQSILKRQYLKGHNPDNFTPAQLGFEAIRNRMERAMGMTRDDFVGMALHERWTAQALDHLSNIVSKIRGLKDSELSAHQKSILDKVRDNIEAAKDAIGATVGAGAGNQPFSVRKEDEPAEGMVRLYRGHDGGEGGAYWSSDKTYASRMGPKMEFVDIPADRLGDHAVRSVEGSGTPNAFKLPPDLTKGAKPLESGGVPTHNIDDLESPLPPTAPGERVVLVRRPDGSIYRAAYAGKQYDVSAGGKAMIEKYGGSKIDSIGTVDKNGKWTHGMLPKGDKIIKGFSPYAAVERSGEPEGPAALRKKGKAGEQEEFFAAVTKKGVPGGEDVQAASAAQLGAKETPPEQKVFAQDIWFQDLPQSEDAQLPYRAITPSEAKNPAELKKILTSEARVGGSSLPVSMTRRLTALFDKRDGTVHLVSTYPGDGTVRMVDPALAGKERPSRPIEEITPNYEPFYSILLREPKQNFHQKFNSMADFQEMFHKEAADLAREHGTGYSDIPQGGDVASLDAPGVREADVPQKGMRLATPFSFPGEKYDLPRPTEAELKDFHNFFGDTPPSDALQWARRIERTAATASRSMVSGLRKLMRIVRAQNRGMSEGEALGQVLDQLYENYNQSDTRSDFVQRTMAQSRPSTAEADAASRRILLAQAEREKRSGARDLSTIRDRPPTEVAGAKPGIAPEPTAAIAKQPVEMLSNEDRAKLEAEIEKEHNIITESRSKQLMQSIVDSPTPKERYRVSGSNKPIEGARVEREPNEGSDALAEDEAARQEAADKEVSDYINRELFPERDVESESPSKPAGESLKAEKKVVAKGEGNKGQLDLFKKHGGPAALRRVEELKEDTADAVSALTAYVKRKASEQQLSATRDAVDTQYSVAGDKADKAIRFVTADKKMPNGNKEVLKAAPTVVQAGAYTIDYPVPDEMKPVVLEKMKQDPIYRNIEGLFSSADPIDKARGGQMLAKLKRETVLQMVDDGEIDWHTGTIKYNKKAFDQLERFGRQLDTAEQKSKNIIESKGGGMQGMLDRRAARARLKAVGDMREQLKYAEEHWNEPELQDTAAKMVVEMEAQHRTERDMGMRVKRAENYLPGRYDEQWFDGDRINFMEGPRILGRNFRKPATFSNYYEAIAAGNYLPFNMDGAALVAHRVRQGMRQIETRLWEKSLKTLKDPHSDKPMVVEPVRRPDGSYTGPSPEYDLVDFGNKYMAVHKGSVDIIKALVGSSIIRDVPATRRAMQFSQKLKHTILFLDTFHLGRLKAYDWSINGIGKGGYKGGLSILEYRPEDIPGAVAKGLVRPEDAEWANTLIDVNLPAGKTQITRRQIADMFLKRGLNAGRIADAIYKVESGPIGKYNKWLFDKFTRGLMLETAVKEFERMNRENPKVDYRRLVDDVARDTNNYMGSIGRQGWIKNQTFQDIFRMFGLAPQWVEGLIKKESALPGRLTGLSYLAGRRDVPLLGTAGRGIARGLAAMFVVTQAINLITRRKPTWQNEEEGHKWDAWIPDVTGKSGGFFMSPLSLFNEVTHDVIRLSGNKPTVYDAVHQIGENKLGPYGRAAMIFATGETPDHRKITSTGGMAKEMGKAMVPVPISLGKVGQAGLAAMGIGQPPAPGTVQRQAMASLGVKTEPAPTANNQIFKKADEFVKTNGLNKSTGWQQIQTDELGYNDLRRAAMSEDKKGFQQALEKLRQTRTDNQIYKAMQLWNARPFTGSKVAEKYFLSDLTDKELDLYSRARVERQQTFSNFQTLLIDELTKQSPAPSK
jgi:hypothetical protein